jgi:hypothetical protein
MTARCAVAAMMLAAMVGCDGAKRAQARTDSILADSLMRVAVAVAAADSARRADSIAAPAAATAPGSKSKGAVQKGTIIGRDSVDPNPKVMRLPTIADTAKRRPPR